MSRDLWGSGRRWVRSGSPGRLPPVLTALGFGDGQSRSAGQELCGHTSGDICLATFQQPATTPLPRFFQEAHSPVSPVPPCRLPGTACPRACWADPAFLGALQDPLSCPNLWVVPPQICDPPSLPLLGPVAQRATPLVGSSCQLPPGCLPGSGSLGLRQRPPTVVYLSRPTAGPVGGSKPLPLATFLESVCSPGNQRAAFRRLGGAMCFHPTLPLWA